MKLDTGCGRYYEKAMMAKDNAWCKNWPQPEKCLFALCIVYALRYSETSLTPFYRYQPVIATHVNTYTLKFRSVSFLVTFCFDPTPYFAFSARQVPGEHGQLGADEHAASRHDGNEKSIQKHFQTR